MFDFLPNELNFRIYRFFDKKTFFAASLVSKCGKKIAEDEKFLLRLLNLNEEHLPANLSAKEIFKIYYELFKFPGNNFSNLIRENKLSLTTLYQSLQAISQAEKGISVGYIFSDNETDFSPLRLCPLVFPFINKTQCIDLKRTYELSRKPIPHNINFLKKKYVYIEFFPVGKIEELLKQDINCIVIYSRNNNAKDFEETYNQVQAGFLKKGRPSPFIISIFDTHRNIKRIENLVTADITLLQTKKILNWVQSKTQDAAKEFFQQLSVFPFPITQVFDEAKPVSSGFWSNLSRVIFKIEEAAAQLKQNQPRAKRESQLKS